MAVPATRAIGPQPISLPDVRRLDRMPSLPEWVDLRVASMNDVRMKVDTDGKRRMTVFLPCSLLLNPVERSEVESHVASLHRLLQQTPLDGDEWEGATLVVITKLMLAVPSSQQSEVGAEASGEAFQAALDDVPTWAVAAAVRRWYRGECGEDDAGKPYSYRWRPAPADLRRIAMQERWKVEHRAVLLRRLLDAEPAPEFDEVHCTLMRSRLAIVFASNAAP